MAGANDEYTLNLTRRTAQPRVMTNFADPDNDGDAGGDDDFDGDGGTWTTPGSPQMKRRP